MWADGSIEINTTNSGVTGSYADKTFDVDDVTFGFTQWMKSTNIQAKKSTTNSCYNVDAIPGTIKKITVVQTGTARAIKMYGGTSSKPTTEITAPSTAATMEFDFTGKNYTYFSMTTPSNAVYINTITITYETSGGGDPTPSVTAPKFDVAAGTYTEDKLVLIDNYNSDYLYAYTLDGTDPAFDENLDVTKGTVYDNDEGIEITSSCTLKAIAVDIDGNASSITSSAYVINKPYPNLVALVAADLATGTNVTVTFNNIPIKSFQTISGTRKGVYFDIQKDGKDIEIYFNSAIPAEWVEGGTLSGTLTNCPWKLYNGTWELAPTSGWAWTNLTYNAPAQKTITALAVSGTPTKTAYNVGDTFETAGLVVTATYSDETSAPITTGFNWEIDYGTGNEAFVAGATSVDVMVYAGEVMSEIFTVNGLTVTVPITLTSIAVSGTPTKTEYYVGDAFETAGLVVTGTYSDSHQEVITEGIDWDIDPETLTLGTTSVDVIAGVDAIISSVYTVNDLTVTENPIKVATKNGFSSGDNSGSHNFTDNTDISFEAFKGNAGTAPAINNSNLRLYQNGGYVTIKGAAGVSISQVKITTGPTYTTTTVGYCVDDEDAPTTGESVSNNSNYTITDLNNQSVSIYCLGTTSSTRLDIAAIEVKYTKEDITLSSIALSGEYQTEFIQNQTFNHDGIVVTANFSNGQDEDVTAKATFSDPDMTTTGTKTITVSYTDGDVTKTAEYDITVAEEVATAIALSGDYQTTFRIGDTFNHDNLVVKATYNSGRSNIDVTSEATVSTPDLSVAGEKTITVSYGGQNANYTIKVLTANTIFYESFDTNNGTGGNDGQWSGSIASNKISSDNDNWTFVSSGGANKCAKFGAGSTKGAATTPALGHEGTAIMTFKSAAWNSKDETLVVNLSVVGDGAISQASITNTKGEWTEYTVTLTGLTAESKVKFEAANASNNRFFLDEILVVLAEEYTRTVTEGRFGTICLPRAVKASAHSGATFYNVGGTYENGIVLVEEEGDLVAGKPYIFKATASELTAVYFGEPVAEAASATGLVGNLGPEAMDVPQGCYVLSNNKLRKLNGGSATIDQYKAYVNLEGVDAYDENGSAESSRRAVYFDYEGTITGIEDISIEEANEIYNLQGQRVNRAQKGVYVVNGRKVIR